MPQSVKLLTSIQEVSDLNPGWDTDHFLSDFRGFTPVLPVESWVHILNRPRPFPSTSFPTQYSLPSYHKTVYGLLLADPLNRLQGNETVYKLTAICGQRFNANS
jgi:hypothetical protein